MLEQDYEILGGDAAGWMADARCAEYANRADAWFSKAGAPAAKQICRGCLVQQDCLSYALSEDIREGVWGGATAEERAELVANGKLTAGLIERWGYRAMKGRIVEGDLEAEASQWADIMAGLATPWTG